MFLKSNSILQNGKYKIIRYLSRGGFGCTYEAENVYLNTRVAIKELFVSDFCQRDSETSQVIVPTVNKRPLFEKLRIKFIKEARAIAALNHPGIIRVLDVFIENNTAYYVMDFIDGQSLHEIIKRDGAMDEAKALSYIRDVAQALHYVHSCKRLHLDIKPANIMVDKSGKTILIDFGVSKQYDEEAGENTSTLMGYTKGFAPVEQMGDDVRQFMPATDIYSLGATLYYMLTAQVPISAHNIAGGAQLPPLPAHISRTTRQAVEAAMIINKNYRTQSVTDFLNMLNGCEDECTVPPDGKTIIPGRGNGGGKPTVNPNKRSTSSGKKNRWKVIVGVLVCVAAIAAGVIFIGDGVTTKTAVDIVDKQVEVTETTPEQPAKVDITAATSRTTSVHAQGTAQQMVYHEPAPAEEKNDTPSATETQKNDEEQMIKAGKGRNGVYEVGYYYDNNGVKGVVFEVSSDGRHGKVVSLDMSRLAWCTNEEYDKKLAVNAYSYDDGAFNTNQISDLAAYPAVQWCKKKGDNWYLPARNELIKISNNLDVINTTLRNHNSPVISDHYWSSTEKVEHATYYVRMSDGANNSDLKNCSDYFVRAVCKF